MFSSPRSAPAERLHLLLHPGVGSIERQVLQRRSQGLLVLRRLSSEKSGTTPRPSHHRPLPATYSLKGQFTSWAAAEALVFEGAARAPRASLTKKDRVELRFVLLNRSMADTSEDLIGAAPRAAGRPVFLLFESLSREVSPHVRVCPKGSGRDDSWGACQGSSNSITNPSNMSKYKHHRPDGRDIVEALLLMAIWSVLMVWLAFLTNGEAFAMVAR